MANGMDAQFASLAQDRGTVCGCSREFAMHLLPALAVAGRRPIVATVCIGRVMEGLYRGRRAIRP